MKRLLFLLIASFSIVFSSNAQEYIELGYNFQKGWEFELKQESKNESYVTVNDIMNRTTRDFNNTLAFTISDAGPNHFTLQFQYKELLFIFNASNRNIVVDAKKDDPKEPLQKALNILLDQTFTVDIDGSGYIKQVSGLEYALKACEVAFKDLKENEQAAYRKILADQFGTDAFRSWLEQLLVIYQSHAIKTGTQWDESVPLRTGLIGRIDLYWNLQHWDSQTAKIAGTGNIKTDKLETFTVEEGIQATAEITGTVQSNYLIDRETGLPRICVQNTEMNGKYIYKANKKKRIKKDIEVPVRIVNNASYKIKRYK